MPGYLLLDAISEASWDRIDALTAAELKVQLWSVMGAFESEAIFDYDKLILLGIVLAATMDEQCDHFALEWLEAHPSALRLDITANLFWGLWKRSQRAEPVKVASVSRFVKVRDSLQLADYVEYNYLYALAESLAPDSSQQLKDLVSPMLQEARKKSFANPNLAKTLKIAIKRALDLR